MNAFLMHNVPVSICVQCAKVFLQENLNCYVQLLNRDLMQHWSACVHTYMRNHG